MHAEQTGRWHPRASSQQVGVAPVAARHLMTAYQQASDAFIDLGGTLEGLADEAAGLLGQSPSAVPLVDIGESMRADANQLNDFVEFIERTDGFAMYLEALPSHCLSDTCRSATDRRFRSLARALARAESLQELIDAVDAMIASGAFDAEGAFTTGTISSELRPIFATAFAIAMDNGWFSGDLPLYVAAGIPAYGDPNPDTLLALGELLSTDRGYQPFETSANPFGLPREEGLFGPVVRYLEARPEVARWFMTDLLAKDPSHRALHHQSTPRSDQLALIILAAGSGGYDLAAQTSFANHLIESLNAGESTNSEVFWATWAVHANLVLDHNIETTTPTFGISRVVPEALRPHWESLWNDRISPIVLKFLSGSGRSAQDTFIAFATPLVVNSTYNDTVPDLGPGNDPGGTFTTRTLIEAANAASSIRVDGSEGERHETAAQRGRRAITEALRDVSPEGPIAADEFAVIDHGSGTDGTSTYSILLPGVIDLSNPSPGFDPVHASVRDLDEVAIRSAPTASVDDNSYAQMVITGLDAIGVAENSNLMLVGHSFGADTVLDLAADEQFNSQFNLTHVVAAGYDSVPQLAAVPRSIDVLVLQNENDEVITLERFHRAMAQGDESISINTFAHDVRDFDGGLGTDIGHHPDRYIDYLNTTSDADLDQFFTGIDAAGFTGGGTKVAIDVSVESPTH